MNYKVAKIYLCKKKKYITIDLRNITDYSKETYDPSKPDHKRKVFRYRDKSGKIEPCQIAEIASNITSLQKKLDAHRPIVPKLNESDYNIESEKGHSLTNEGTIESKEYRKMMQSAKNKGKEATASAIMEVHLKKTQLNTSEILPKKTLTQKSVPKKNFKNDVQQDTLNKEISEKNSCNKDIIEETYRKDKTTSLGHSNKNNRNAGDDNNKEMAKVTKKNDEKFLKRKHELELEQSGKKKKGDSEPSIAKLSTQLNSVDEEFCEKSPPLCYGDSPIPSPKSSRNHSRSSSIASPRSSLEKSSENLVIASPESLLERSRENSPIKSPRSSLERSPNISPIESLQSLQENSPGNLVIASPESQLGRLSNNSPIESPKHFKRSSHRSSLVKDRISEESEISEKYKNLLMEHQNLKNKYYIEKKRADKFEEEVAKLNDNVKNVRNILLNALKTVEGSRPNKNIFTKKTDDKFQINEAENEEHMTDLGQNVLVKTSIFRKANRAPQPSIFVTTMAYEIWGYECLARRCVKKINRTQSLSESKEDENENTSFKQLTPKKKNVLEEHYENYLKNNGYTDKSFDANMKLLNKHLNTAINGARRHIDPKKNYKGEKKPVSGFCPDNK